MAYCVNCGVKLHEAETSCPLCGTEVAHPTKAPDPDAERSYPVRTTEQTLRVSRRYALSLLSLLLLVPAGLCLLIDFLGGGITWSIYPAGVLVILWVAISVPLLMRRHRLYSTLVITGVAIAVYLFLVQWHSRTPEWFFPIVLPALVLAIAMLCFTIWRIRSKRTRLLRLIGLVMAEIGILCFAIELLCVRAGVGSGGISWSPFVIMPCFFMALLLYVISRNGTLSTELKRRFHF